jgi:hypothetical protein
MRGRQRDCACAVGKQRVRWNSRERLCAGVDGNAMDRATPSTRCCHGGVIHLRASRTFELFPGMAKPCHPCDNDSAAAVFWARWSPANVYNSSPNVRCKGSAGERFVADMHVFKAATFRTGGAPVPRERLIDSHRRTGRVEESFSEPFPTCNGRFLGRRESQHSDRDGRGRTTLRASSRKVKPARLLPTIDRMWQIRNASLPFVGCPPIGPVEGPVDRRWTRGGRLRHSLAERCFCDRFGTPSLCMENRLRSLARPTMLGVKPANRHKI